jgi:hypothetical protein
VELYILKADAFVSVRAIDAHLGNLTKFGVIELAHILKNFIVARQKDIALLEFWFCCCCHNYNLLIIEFVDDLVKCPSVTAYVLEEVKPLKWVSAQAVDDTEFFCHECF